MISSSSRAPLLTEFSIIRNAETRWSDNDVFGHLNNAVYYQLFDTAINGWLAEIGHSATDGSEIRGVVAESSCRFYRELQFPQRLVVGIEITKIGTSSVTYRLAIREADTSDGTPVAAVGFWAQVFVSTATGLATPIPPSLKRALPKPIQIS
jgi:acyl-CoA thioester hydrolase